MVLAAGLGLRMRPLSSLVAKPALPVLNRPLLHWTLELLARHGVTDVIVNTHHLPASVRRAVGDGSRFGLAVSWSHERRLLGTGGGPRRVRAFFAGQPFLLVNGDVVFDFDLTGLVARHRAYGAGATLALKPNPDPRRYGPVVTAPDGRVRSLAGRPRPARGLVSLFTGVHVLEPSLLERLPRGASDSVLHLYAPLVAEGGRLLGVRVRGPWYDLGDPQRYLASQLSMLSSGTARSQPTALVHPEARVHARARVVRSIVGAGSVVEADALVRDSVLWDRVTVRAGAMVQRSVLSTRARVGARQRLEGVVLAPRRRGGVFEPWPLEPAS
jgi:NDP-sugar pyrophosphorylase family protein